MSDGFVSFEKITKLQFSDVLNYMCNIIEQHLMIKNQVAKQKAGGIVSIG